MFSQLLQGFTKYVWFRFLCLFLACVAMVSFGILGVGRGGGFSEGAGDSRFIYVAGLTWLKGLNAYDPQAASLASGGLIAADRYDFAYPPQIFPLAMLMGLFPWDKARSVITLVNLLSLGFLTYFCIQLVRRGELKSLNDLSDAPLWFIPALIIGNPFTAHVLWMGQTTLISAAACLASWQFYRQKHWLVSGLFLTISTIKPQISLLIVVWFLLERQWKILVAASVSALVFCLVPMIITGPVDVFTEWLQAISGYKSNVYNTLGFRHVFGVQNFLYALNLKVPVLLPLGLLLAGLLWWQKSKFVQDDLLPILLLIVMLFGFSHDYDLIALAPVISSFWRHLQNRSGEIVIALALMAGMFFPQRFLRPFNIEVLLQFRVVIILICAIWLLIISYQRAISQLSEAAYSDSR